MVKRVPKNTIVSGGKRVLPAGHPDLFWYDPSEVIVIGDEQYIVAGSKVPAGVGDVPDSLVGEDPGEEKENDKRTEVTADVPQLSDIESIEFTKYFNEANVERAKVIIKIRNSSKNKDNVVGVDARIKPNA